VLCSAAAQGREWYVFRGVNGWAVDLLEKGRKNGANVSLLALARCYWLLAEDEHEPNDKRPAHVCVCRHAFVARASCP